MRGSNARVQLKTYQWVGDSLDASINDALRLTTGYEREIVEM